MALPLNGSTVVGATGGGVIVVPGADPGDVPPWPLAVPTLGSGIVSVGSKPGSGIVRVGDPLEPIAAADVTPTRITARVRARSVNGRPSPETRRPRAAQ
jgi:hypothetical protein